MKRELPLVVELAEPKMIAGDLDIQLSSRTSSRGKCASLNFLGVQVDVAADVQIDDNIA